MDLKQGFVKRETVETCLRSAEKFFTRSKDMYEAAKAFVDAYESDGENHHGKHDKQKFFHAYHLTRPIIVKTLSTSKNLRGVDFFWRIA